MTCEITDVRPHPSTWLVLSPQYRARLQAELSASNEAGRRRVSPTVEIEPLPSGRARFELDGAAYECDGWESAIAECRRLGGAPELLPFPSPSVEVLATAPAWRVLA